MNTQKLNPIKSYNNYCGATVRNTAFASSLSGFSPEQTPEKIADAQTRKQFHIKLDKYITSSVVYDAETHQYQSDLTFDVNQFIEDATANSKPKEDTK